jgi:ribosomal protein S18 acetylase RimI-like enzyme
MHIRVYSESDEDAVAALWTEAFGYAGAHNEPRRAIRAKLAFQPDLFFVAEVDGLLVGTAMGGYDGHRGWLYSVAVAPDFRRRGVGAALVRRVEAALRELGCPKVNLQIRASNAEIAPFYASLGFVVEDRVSMGKVLE